MEDNCTPAPNFAALIHERDSLAEQVAELRSLLTECAPHVLASAEAAHLTDGFRPQRLPLDDLADRVRREVKP